MAAIEQVTNHGSLLDARFSDLEGHVRVQVSQMEHLAIFVDLHQDMQSGEQYRVTQFAISKSMDENSLYNPTNTVVYISNSHGQDEDTMNFQEIQSGCKST